MTERSAHVGRVFWNNFEKTFRFVVQLFSGGQRDAVGGTVEGNVKIHFSVTLGRSN